jgi:hypothetical protein
MKFIAVLGLFLATTMLCGQQGVAQDAVNGVIPGPPTGYQWILPLDFDGTSFSVPKEYAACGKPWDAHPYFARSSGSLALKSAILLMPGCPTSADQKNVPSKGDSPQLYIVAVPLSWYDGKPNARHFEANTTVPAIAIAGPVYPDSDPWVFEPSQPGLTMRAGYGYMFFVAQLALI